MISNQEEKQSIESDFQVILILKSEVNDCDYPRNDGQYGKLVTWRNSIYYKNKMNIQDNIWWRIENILCSNGVRRRR